MTRPANHFSYQTQSAKIFLPLFYSAGRAVGNPIDFRVCVFTPGAYWCRTLTRTTYYNIVYRTAPNLTLFSCYQNMNMHCSDCNKHIRKNAVVCCRCRAAWHPTCAGVNKNLSKRQGENWMCRSCSFSTVHDEGQAVDRDLQDLRGPRDTFFVPSPAEQELMQRCRRLESYSKSVTNKLDRLTSENGQQRMQMGRLTDDVHRLRDSSKMATAMIRKLKIRQVSVSSPF